MGNSGRGFFDDYSEFYKTSKTIPSPNRLNNRYIFLIENNIEIIKGRSILDIASHDGRWSFAAIKNGASHVLGIEGRKELVESSYTNMQKYGIPKEKYSFIVGDIFQEIKKIKSNTIDTVFCFGYFYHTMNHMFLLDEIARLSPKHLILDTSISESDSPIIEVTEEDSKDPRNAIIIDPVSNNSKVVVGSPSKKALDIMLSNVGFIPEYFDWHKYGIQNWENIEDYNKNIRVSLVAKNLRK